MENPLDKELLFSPEGNRIWTAILDDDFIYVEQSIEGTKVLHERNFEDLHDALAYLKKSTGQRPTFGMDENTANTKARS